MENKDLVEKLLAKQEKIWPALEKLRKDDVLPSKLTKAMDNVETWTKKIQGEDGPNHDAREWPIAQFAHELKENISLFDRETAQQVREYEELAGKLKYDFDEAM